MSAVAYLVVANPSSKNNLGTLIRCAAAFGVEEVVVVGAPKWSTHGAHGSHKHVKYRWFGDWESAATFLRLERGCDLCGIVQASFSISDRPAASSSGKNVVAAMTDSKMPPSASPSTAATIANATPSTAATIASTTPSTAATTASTAPSTAATTASSTPSTSTTPSIAASTASTTACAPPPDGADEIDPKSQEEEAGMPFGHVLDSRQNDERSEQRSEERSEERSGEAGEIRRGGVGVGVGTAGTAAAAAAAVGCDYSYDSLAVRDRPFRRSTAFLVGHRNRLEANALDVCDFLVHVEQATEFTMDLGPPVTTSIALHHFTAWANYSERRFEGEKFDVDENAARCRPPVNKEKGLAEERLRLREERRAADPLEPAGGGGREHRGDGHGDDNAEVGGGLKWLSGAGDDDVDEEADY